MYCHHHHGIGPDPPGPGRSRSGLGRVFSEAHPTVAQLMPWAASTPRALQ